MPKRLVVDSSVLILLTRRGTLEEYLKGKKDEGYAVIIPKAITKKLIDEPRLKYTLERISYRWGPQLSCRK